MKEVWVSDVLKAVSKMVRYFSNQELKFYKCLLIPWGWSSENGLFYLLFMGWSQAILRAANPVVGYIEQD